MSVIYCDNRLCSLEKDSKLHELLLKREYSLNSVNNYGDSLLHTGAAFGCTLSVKTILDQNKNNANIDRKNKFGWTPLMHAIRANNIQTVKILLKYGADVTHRTYLGTSALTMAVGIGSEMFEIIYNACPSILENSVHDDITPLCVAAMKNDRNLFSKLMELGLDPKNEGIYTHLVMRESMIPEIRNLAMEKKDIEDYWNNDSDNIPITREESRCENEDESGLDVPVNTETSRNSLPSILVDSPKNAAGNSVSKSLNNRRDSKLPNLDLLSIREAHFRESQSISPNLIYNLDSWFSQSPSIFENSQNPAQTTPNNESEVEFKSFSQKQRQIGQKNFFAFNNVGENLRARKIESSEEDPKTENGETNLNISLTFVPEFSPSRSPYLPSDFEDEDFYGEDTPTPPHYKTPPRGMVLNSEQAKLVIALKQFDLAHHVSRFLTEEVDMNLFLTLNDQDLKEIGIHNEKDRESLLAVIEAYTKDEKH